MIFVHVPSAMFTYVAFVTTAVDGDLETLLGLPACRTLEAGITATVAGFREARDRGIDLEHIFQQTLGKTP